MRTRIYLDPEKTTDDDPYIDVNHDEPLTDELIAMFRAVLQNTVDAGWASARGLADLPPDYSETAE